MDYPNVDPFIGAIVASGKASLRELKTELTLEDAFDIWEVLMVQNFNEWLAAKKATKK